jgi:pyruvate carboxylase subunit B
MVPDMGRRFLEDRAAGRLQPEPLLPPPDGERPIVSEGVPTEFVVGVHGETYRVDIIGVSLRNEGKRHFYISIDGVPEEVEIEALKEYVAGTETTKRKQAAAAGDVTTAMPGNILEVLVKEGDLVRAGQPVLVTEAMKMQTEVQAPVSGRVKHVYVKRGDRVNPGEVLIEIEPE